MRTLLIAIAVLSCSLSSIAQDIPNDKLTILAKAWSGFMLQNEPPKGYIKNLKANMPEGLQPAAEFISQTITSDNDLLKDKFLTIPEAATLKNIYIIRSVVANIREEYRVDNDKLIDSLKAADIPRNDMVYNYYDMLFTGVGNKNKPFNMSRVNLNLNNYKLANNTEQGIFFLQCMSLCGSMIWGYMNVVKPPNTSKALEFIAKFPRVNSLDYYQFTDLLFPDFEITIAGKKQSYKSFYIDKYYELLLNHMTAMQEEKAPVDIIQHLVLGSIIKDRILYKYTKHKDRLEKVLQIQKTE